MRAPNFFTPTSTSLSSPSSPRNETMNDGSFGTRRRRALSAVVAAKKKARALAASATASSTSAGASKNRKEDLSRTPTSPPVPKKKVRTVSSAPPLMAATAASTTVPTCAATSAAASSSPIVTTTSCTERLHFVLARKNKEQLAELQESLRTHHAGVKTVCIYTDSPLVSRTPLSQRQQKLLLLSMSEACTEVTNLQLDFSSEFGPQTEVILDCELLATIIQKAHKLESLLLKDVSLKGNVQVLQQALLQHRHLSKMELKWCTEVMDDSSTTTTTTRTTTPALVDVDVDDWEEEMSHTILPSLITTLSQLPQLTELTILVSNAHNLPLPTLAHSKTLRKLSLGLEQRQTGATAQTTVTTTQTTTAQSIVQRHAEQVLLIQLLQELQRNNCLQECNLFSHHWKSSMTLSCICDLLGGTAASSSSISTLQHFSLTDYNYGSDDPRKLLQLAAAIQHNPHLKRFKLVTKKRVSSTVDKKTRKANSCRIDTAFVEALEQNFTLQHLDISHAGITISGSNSSGSATGASAIQVYRCATTGSIPTTFSDSTSTSSSNNNRSASTTTTILPLSSHHGFDPNRQQPNKPKNMIPFYLMTNRYGARGQFLFQERVNLKEWKEFVAQNKDNTPLLFYLLQANPSLLIVPTLMMNGGGCKASSSSSSSSSSAGYYAKHGWLGGRQIWEYYF